MKPSKSLLLTLLLASPLPCLATGQAAPAPAPAPRAAETRPAPAQQAAAEPQWGAGSGAELLAAARGGADRVANEATLGGTVSGNSAVNLSTGSNTIDTGSFANASGLPVVIQNSGSNVLIQNATVINLQLQ